MDGGNIGALVIVSKGRYKGRQGAIRGATETHYTVELSQSNQKHVVVPMKDVEIVSDKAGEGFARKVLKGGQGFFPGGGAGAGGEHFADGGKTPLFTGLGGATPAFGGDAYGSRVRCLVLCAFWHSSACAVRSISLPPLALTLSHTSLYFCARRASPPSLPFPINQTPAMGEFGGKTPMYGDGGRTPMVGDGEGGKTPMYGEGGGGKTPMYGDGGGGKTPMYGDGGGGTTPLCGGGGGGKTPMFGGATPQMGASSSGGGGGVGASAQEDFERLQQERATAAGIAECDLIGRWVDKGVRVDVVKGPHAGRAGFIKLMPTSNLANLVVCFDGTGTSGVNVKLTDCIPVAAAKDKALNGDFNSRTVMVLHGAYRGRRATIVTFEEDDDAFLLNGKEEGGEEEFTAESIPRNLCILVQS